MSHCSVSWISTCKLLAIILFGLLDTHRQYPSHCSVLQQGPPHSEAIGSSQGTQSSLLTTSTCYTLLRLFLFITNEENSLNSLFASVAFPYLLFSEMSLLKLLKVEGAQNHIFRHTFTIVCDDYITVMLA